MSSPQLCKTCCHETMRATKQSRAEGGSNDCFPPLSFLPTRCSQPLPRPLQILGPASVQRLPACPTIAGPPSASPTLSRDNSQNLQTIHATQGAGYFNPTLETEDIPPPNPPRRPRAVGPLTRPGASAHCGLAGQELRLPRSPSMPRTGNSKGLGERVGICQTTSE
eukprot:5061749-Amphidinium_carterae.1